LSGIDGDVVAPAELPNIVTTPSAFRIVDGSQIVPREEWGA
jgi:hypothetical protein